MRDTFADTSLARADLGFAPEVSLEQGLEAEYRWLASTPALVELMPLDSNDVLLIRMMLSLIIGAIQRLRRCAARDAASRCVMAALTLGCAGGSASRRPARRSPTSSCSSAAPRRSTRSAGSSRASTSASSSTPTRRALPRRRQARHRRHVSRRRHRPSRTCWRSTSSASSWPSTRRTGAPTTRSSSSG